MNVITTITSVVYELFCIHSCAPCHERITFHETEEKILPISSIEKVSKENSFVVGAEILPISSIEKVPKENSFVVGADLASENIDCSICLESYEVGQKLSILSCMHFYHESCLSEWNKDHVKCPFCEKNINVIIID